MARVYIDLDLIGPKQTVSELAQSCKFDKLKYENTGNQLCIYGHRKQVDSLRKLLLETRKANSTKAAELKFERQQDFVVEEHTQSVTMPKRIRKIEINF